MPEFIVTTPNVTQPPLYTLLDWNTTQPAIQAMLGWNSTETTAGNDTFNWNITDTNNDETKSLFSKIFLPALMFFVGVFGNVLALVILQVRPSKDSRSTAFYHLVKGLAVVDLTGIVALSPVPLATQGQLVKTGGMAVCHYFSFAILLAGHATLAIVLVMAIERFMVTKFPFQYQNLVTRRNLNITIASLWLFSILLAALPIIGFGRNADRWPGTWCFFDYRDDSIYAYSYSIFYASLGILIIIATFILNTIVIKHLWRMRRSRIGHNSVRSSTPSTPSTKEPDSEKRMVFFLMTIIIIFTICYTPLMIRVLMNQLLNVRDVEPGGMDDQLDLWALRFASFNQIIDPWIYIISRFTCCTGKREKGRRGDVSRSPNRTIMSTVTNTPSPKRNIIGRSVDHVRSLLNNSRPENQEIDNTMVPLSTEFTSQVDDPQSATMEGTNGDTNIA